MSEHLKKWVIYFLVALALLGFGIIANSQRANSASAQVGSFEASSGPQNLTVALSQGGVALNWGPALTGNFTSPTGYQVYRASSQNGPYSQVGMLSFPENPTPSLLYLDQPGPGTWYYLVRAFSLVPFAQSAPSNVCSINVVVSESLTANSKLITSNSVAATPTPTMQPFFPNGPPGTQNPLVSGSPVCGAGDANLGLDMMLNCSEQGLQDRTWYFIIANNSSVPFTVSSAGLTMKLWVYESQLRCTALTGSNGNIYNSSGTQVGSMVLVGNQYSKNTSMTEIDESSTHKANQYGLIPITYQSGTSIIPAGGWMQGFAIYETAAAQCGNVQGNWDNFADDYSGMPMTQASCNGNPSGPYWCDHHFALYSNGTLVQEIQAGGSDDPQSGIPPGGGTCTPTFTWTNTWTKTPTPSWTITRTSTPTFSATKTPTSSLQTPTFTFTSTPTRTMTFTPTQSKTFTQTWTPTKTQTWTPTNTQTWTPTNTQTWTPTNTQTWTPTNTQTWTPTNTQTWTPTNTQTWTPTNTQTWTPTNTQTWTPTNTQTWTPTDTQTWTPTNTQTWTPTNTQTWTPTDTQTWTPTNTQTFTQTWTPTYTQTWTPTNTQTWTPTNTQTWTPTNTQTWTPTDTQTWTPTNTQTWTPTNTQTWTPTNTPTFTLTFTMTDTPTQSPTQTTTFTPSSTPTYSQIYCSLINSLPGYASYGMALDSQGNLYFTDAGYPGVFVVGPGGTLITQWGGVKGKGNGQFDSPLGIAVNSQGTTVYVADANNNRIQVFDNNGNYLYQWGQQGNGNGQFNGPYAIGSNSAGTSFYVTDFNNQRVQVFDGQGNYLSQWGSPSAGGAVVFNTPKGLALDGAGDVYVADDGTGMVYQFDYSGNLQNQWNATNGTGLLGANLLAVDPSGNIYLTDGFGEAGIFSPGGVPFEFTQVGNPPSYDTEGIAAGPASWYVADNTNAVIYEYGNCSLTPPPTNTPTFTPTPTPTQAPCAVVYFSDAGMNYPAEVALDGAGNVYDIENGAGQVQVFAPNGNNTNSWNGSTSGTAFSGPQGLAVDQANGLVYVSDTGNGRIAVFKTDGTYQSQWGSQGSGGNGYFNAPVQVCVPGDGYVYVADWGNGLIQKFTADSNHAFVTQFDGSTVPNGGFSGPAGIQVDGQGNLYVSDSYNGRIVALDKYGNYVTQWTGNGPLPLNYPYQSWIGPDNNLYVADFGNSQIQVFTLQGGYLNSFDGITPDFPMASPTGVYAQDPSHIYVADFGLNNVMELVDCSGPSTPLPTNTPTFTPTPTNTFTPTPTLPALTCPLTNPVQVNAPEGVALDSAGNIYVADDNQDTVDVFYPNGSPLAQVGGGQLGDPIGVAVDRNGFIYVTDFANNAVDVFNLQGSLVNSWGGTGNGNGTFDGPAGIAVNAGSNLVYVVDYGNQLVQEFNTQGHFINQWGGQGQGQGAFMYPWDVGVDSSGQVYVADGGNSLVQVFTGQGGFVRQWSTAQLGWTEFVAVDSANQLFYVSNSGGLVGIYGSNGALLGAPVGPGNGFCDTEGLAVGNGSWFAADACNNVVDQFSSCNLNGTPINSPVFTPTFTPTPTNTFTPTITYTPTPTPVPVVYGCPFQVFEDSSIDGPWAVAADASGYVYEAEAFSGQVQVFNASGVPIHSWDGSSSGQGAFVFPAGIAVDNNAHEVYVSDSGNNRIMVFGVDGTYHRLWGSTGTDNGQFEGPSQVALFGGNVYVADTQNNRVQEFTTLGVYVNQFGSAGSGNGQLSVPQGVALDTAGNLYVADSGNSRVEVFNPQGVYEVQWGTFGSSPGQFSEMGQISVTPDNWVFVADGNNRRVQVFDTLGNLQGQIDGSGPQNVPLNLPLGVFAADTSHVYIADAGLNQVVLAGPCAGIPTSTFTPTPTPTPTVHYISFCPYQAISDDSMLSPAAVALDGGANIYEVDETAGLVQEFNSSRTLLNTWDGTTSGLAFNGPLGVAVDKNNGLLFVADTGNNRMVEIPLSVATPIAWGTSGTALGQFSSPSAVAVSPTGLVYVADSGNNRVESFKPNGTPVSQFGVYGSGTGQLNNPLGVATDGAGNVYVSDTGNGRVVVFTASGSPLTQWGTAGTAAGQFDYPGQITVGPDNLVYVADSGNQRVQVFDTLGNFVEQFNGAGPLTQPFADPSGVAVLDPNHVYVSDMDMGQIDVLEPCSQVPSPTNTNTPANTPTPTPTLPFTYTPTPTFTPTPTATFTPTPGPETCPALTSFTVSSPEGVALDSQGNAYVANIAGNQIDVFNPKGQPLTQIYWQDNPLGVAVDSNGTIYVTEYQNDAIYSLDTSGNLVFLGQTNYYGYSDMIGGIAVNSAASTVYVADEFNSRIMAINTQTHAQSSFGNGVFYSPFGVALDASGQVYVTDPDSARVFVFTPQGGLVTQWDAIQDTPLYGVYGIAVDANGVVYVSDEFGTVAQFDSRGNYLGAFYGENPGFENAGFLAAGTVPGTGAVLWAVADRGNGLVEEFGSCSQAPTPTPVSTPSPSPTPLLCPSSAISDANMDSPEGVAVDGSGNIYEVESMAGQVQVFDPYGNFVDSWSGSAAYHISFLNPQGIAVDPAQGLVYVADTGNNAVEWFSRNGTFEGSWSNYFDSPKGLTVGPDSAVYVADTGHNRVLKLHNGNQLTFGNNSSGGRWTLKNPEGVALDAAGNVYVADTGNGRIAVFNATAQYQYQWTNNLLTPVGAAMGPNPLTGSGQALYVSDMGQEQIIVFDLQGNYLAQTNGSSPSTGSGQGLLGPFGNLHGLAAGDAGHIYAADTGANQVVELGLCSYTPVPTPVTTPGVLPTICLQHALSLGPIPVPTQSGGGYGETPSPTPTPMGFQAPSGIVVAASNNIYVVEQQANRVQVFDNNGGFLFRFGAQWTGSQGTDQLNSPQGIAIGSDGNVYVSDTGNGRMVEFDPNGNYIGNFNGGLPYFQPKGVFSAPNGNLYVVDSGDGQVDVFLPGGTLQGTVGENYLIEPASVAVDGSNNVYVTDQDDDTIQVFDASGNDFLQMGGYGQNPGEFQGIWDVKFSGGLVWATENGNASDRVQVFEANGTPVTQFTGDQFNGSPFGGPRIFLDPLGNLYVAEVNRNAVQKFWACTDIPTPTPTPAPLPSPCVQQASSLLNSLIIAPPAGITVDSNGLVYVNQRNQVRVFGAQGQYQRILDFSSIGYSKAGLAVDPQGRVAVPMSNNSILVLNANGSQAASFGSSGSGPGQFDTINAVAASPSGCFYATDQGNNRVNVFNGGATFLFSFGAYGALPGQFNQPMGIAVDSSGNVYVSDANDRVQKFTSTGRLITQWGGNTQFVLPAQISLDANGLVYVSDPGNFNYQIQVFDAYGRFLKKIPVDKTAFPFPSAAASPNGSLYVVSTIGSSGPLTIGRYLPCGIVNPIPTPTATLAAPPCVAPVLQWAQSLKSPVGVVFDQNRVIVADQGTEKVSKFLDNGVGAGNVNISANGTILGIALGPDGNFYVINSAGTVEIFNSTGVQVGNWQNNYVDVEKMAFDAGGRAYIPLSNEGMVLIYNPYNPVLETASLAATLGQPGSLPGQFTTPRAIAFDAGGNIYVGEQGVNQRISVFDPGGTCLRTWGSPGTGNGQFHNISAMQFDPNGLLWVADGANRIQVFDPYGNYIETIGSTGAGTGQFNNPQGLAFDNSGGLYVADSGNGRIERWGPCVAASGPSPTPTPIAAVPSYHLWLDVGGSNLYIDQNRNPWIKDQAYKTGGYGYVQGGTASSQTVSVSGTLDPALYQTYRAGPTLSYEFAVPPDTYSVTLLAADFTATGANQDVFNVSAQGQQVLSNVDIFAAVGQSAAMTETFQVTVAPGAPLTLLWNAAKGNALVSAIAIAGTQPNASPPLIYIRKPSGAALHP